MVQRQRAQLSTFLCHCSEWVLLKAIWNRLEPFGCCLEHLANASLVQLISYCPVRLNSHNDLLFLDIVITVICFDENCITNLLPSLALAGLCYSEAGGLFTYAPLCMVHMCTHIIKLVNCQYLLVMLFNI